MEVQELRARLDQNSGNSSRPPSSDVIKPKRKRSTGLPKASKLKGGQKGHKGGTLKMVEQADEVKQLRPSRCACGQRLLRQSMSVHARRQLFDLPEPTLDVVEYQQMSCCCPSCGAQNLGQFPDVVKAPVQYAIGRSNQLNTACVIHIYYEN